jgi:hypothetical protein
MSPRRARRDPNSRTVTKLPEQALEACVLELAAAPLERLGADPTPEAVHRTIEQTIAFWNATSRASGVWDPASSRALDTLTRRMTGRRASAADREAFELLSTRWRELKLIWDPRRIGEWSLELVPGEAPRLRCALELPDGVEELVPPPPETRIAIGDHFLDETTLRVPSQPGVISRRCFPPEQHQGTVQDDGTVIIETRMGCAFALLAEGLLPPIGGRPVGLVVHGVRRDAMVLTEVRCDDRAPHRELAVLYFAPASGAVPG